MAHLFHTLVVLMVVLTFSTSFATLAQQNPVLTEVSKTAAQNPNTVALEAKAAAEQDASKDTNEPFRKWSSVSFHIQVSSSKYRLDDELARVASISIHSHVTYLIPARFSISTY